MPGEGPVLLTHHQSFSPEIQHVTISITGSFVGYRHASIQQMHTGQLLCSRNLLRAGNKVIFFKKKKKRDYIKKFINVNRQKITKQKHIYNTSKVTIKKH